MDIKSALSEFAHKLIYTLEEEIVDLNFFIETVEQAKVEPEPQGVQTDQNLGLQDNNADQNRQIPKVDIKLDKMEVTCLDL